MIQIASYRSRNDSNRHSPEVALKFPDCVTRAPRALYGSIRDVLDNTSCTAEKLADKHGDGWIIRGQGLRFGAVMITVSPAGVHAVPITHTDGLGQADARSQAIRERQMAQTLRSLCFFQALSRPQEAQRLLEWLTMARWELQTQQGGETSLLRMQTSPGQEDLSGVEITLTEDGGTIAAAVSGASSVAGAQAALLACAALGADTISMSSGTICQMLVDAGDLGYGAVDEGSSLGLGGPPITDLMDATLRFMRQRVKQRTH